MRLTVTRQTALNLTVKKGHFFTVNHQTQVKINRNKVLRFFKSHYSWLSITWTIKGNRKQFELSGVRSNITRSKEIDGGGMCETEKQLFHLTISVEPGFAFTKG